MAVYPQSVLTPDPLYLQPKSYDARSDRKHGADVISQGVLAAITGSSDYAVTYSGAVLTLNIAAGVGYVLGANIADQGMYRQYIATGTSVTASPAHATLPRIDTMILRIMDNAADASGFNEARIELVPGTATSGATLANLTGKANLTTLGEASKSVLLLAYVLIPAAATVLTNTATNVLDARVRATIGSGTAAILATPAAGSVTQASFAAGAAAGQSYGTVLPTAGLYNGYRFTFFPSPTNDNFAPMSIDVIYRADLDATYPWFAVAGSDAFDDTAISVPGGSTASYGGGATLYAPRAGYYSVNGSMQGASSVGGSVGRLAHSSAGVLATESSGGNITNFSVAWQGLITGNNTVYVRMEGATGDSARSWASQIQLRARRIV